MIRDVKLSDAETIADIYSYYIKNSIATFEEDKITKEEIRSRIEIVMPSHTWLVYEEDGYVRGYAYSSKWKDRKAYRYTAEIAVYIEDGYSGKGIGSYLMKRLVEESEKKNLHKLMGGISLPNDASVALHEKFGFKKCAHFRESGYKFGKWIDVGYWEKILRNNF